LKKVIFIFFQNLYSALLAAITAICVWIFIFFMFSIILNMMGITNLTSLFALSLAFCIALTFKVLISWLGTDSDFRQFFTYQKDFQTRKYKIVREGSVVLLIVLCLRLMYSSGMTPQNTIFITANISEVAYIFAKYINVLLVLFLAQLVMSYPDSSKPHLEEL